MQKKPVFHLFVPFSLQSLNNWHQGFEFDTPYLSILLTQFENNKNKSKSLDMAFFQALNSETAELPIAYYRYQLQTNQNKDGLICADPVHLQVGMNDVTLTQKITDLSDTEAKELIDVFNKHFAEDGLQFIFGSNQCWYVSFEDNGTINSHDLDSVIMQDITGKLTKATHRNWEAIQNEIQMLLHASEVNQQREIAGLTAVNSLWFWGAGAPIATEFEITTIYSSNDRSLRLKGQLFAKAANCEWQELPEDMTLLTQPQLDNKASTRVLLLEQLRIPALEGNLDDFQLELTQLDKQIIKPLLTAWQNNDIDIVIDCCNGIRLTPQKPPLWKFWLKPKKLRELVNEINS